MVFSDYTLKATMHSSGVVFDVLNEWLAVECVAEQYRIGENLGRGEVEGSKIRGEG